MSKEDDKVPDRLDNIGGYEVPAAGNDPDGRLRLVKHARAAAETAGEDVSEYDDEVTDERNRAGRGPQQDAQAAEDLQAAKEARAKAAADKRKTASESTSEDAASQAPQGRSATPPARSTTAATKSTAAADKDKGK